MTLRTCNNFLKENYESPSVEVIDVMSEGVFCVSEKEDRADSGYDYYDLGEI